jgi:hypothetical protein
MPYSQIKLQKNYYDVIFICKEDNIDNLRNVHDLYITYTSFDVFKDIMTNLTDEQYLVMDNKNRRISIFTRDLCTV